MQSVMGTILDPAADKVLMTTLTVTLAMKDLIPGACISPCCPSYAMPCSDAIHPMQFLSLQLYWVETFF